MKQYCVGEALGQEEQSIKYSRLREANVAWVSQSESTKTKSDNNATVISIKCNNILTLQIIAEIKHSKTGTVYRYLHRYVLLLCTLYILYRLYTSKINSNWLVTTITINSTTHLATTITVSPLLLVLLIVLLNKQHDTQDPVYYYYY